MNEFLHKIFLSKMCIRDSIKSDSLVKALYQKKSPKPINPKTAGPHFQFRVTNWQGFEQRLNEFRCV